MKKTPSPTVPSHQNEGPGRPPFTKGNPRAAVQLLRGWRENGEEEDHRETLEALRRGINSSRVVGCEVLP